MEDLVDSYIRRLMTRVVPFALLAGLLLNPAPSPAANNGAGNCVLDVLVTYQTCDERLPWRLSPPQNRAGYGLVVGPGRILTTEDLVRQATLVELRRPGHASKFTALVTNADPQLDAALLAVRDTGLLPHLEPVVLATNLERGAETRIVQYEDSGAPQEGTGRIVELSVEALPAAPAAVLTCRVLSDLRVMNTGAPVFIGSRLAGLMMRYDAQRQSGFVLPAPILARFLRAAAAPVYHAPPYAGFTWMALVDPVLRRYLGVPEAGDGRIKALSEAANRAIRVLSPRIEPPVRAEEGSTASTATLWPRSIRNIPSTSMVVDLPTPGEPVMPTRTALPVSGSSACTRSRARV